jgi:hypothetical protein
MQSLNDLIGSARAAANLGPAWITDGARACPIEWGDCSQPVYVDAVSGAYDYGEPGGLAHDECETECPHRLALPEWAEDEVCDEIWNEMQKEPT